MSAFIYNFTARADAIEIGARWEQVISYYTDDNFTVPMDFTGWTNVHAQIRETIESSSALLLDFATAGNSVTLSGQNLTLVINNANSAAITWREGHIQVEGDDTNGYRHRLLDGNINSVRRTYA